MKITIDLDDIQIEALNKANIESNPKQQPPIEEFIISFVDNYVDNLVIRYQQRDLDNVKNKLNEVVSKLSAADLNQVLAVAQKYS